MAVRRVLCALALLALLAPAAAMAEDESGWSYQLAHDVMSPFCPGLTLAECPSPNASDLREWIIEQERAGVSKARVEELLFERFGDQLLQAPRAEGVGLVAYAIPAGGLLLGGILVATVLRRPSTGDVPRRTTPEPAPAPAADDELARAIDAEIDD